MNLERFRKERKLTQEKASKLLGMQKQTYQNYELRKRQPDIETLCKLADFYHCSLDELVGRETDMINLNMLEPEVSTLIKKIIKMNNEQKKATVNFVTGLTFFDN